MRAWKKKIAKTFVFQENCADVNVKFTAMKILVNVPLLELNARYAIYIDFNSSVVIVLLGYHMDFGKRPVYKRSDVSRLTTNYMS